MKPFYLLLLSASVALGATEENLDRTFKVDPGGTLTVDVNFGSIEVSTNSGSDVVVKVYRKIERRSAKAEQEFLKANPVEFDQNGTDVKVTCNHPATISGWFKRGSNQAKYTVSVPGRYHARLTTAGGAIEARDLVGNTHARTSGGGLKFQRLQGNVDGVTSGGGIHIADCTGTLSVITSGGGIQAQGGGGSLKAQTSGGSVTVKDFQGPAQVSSSGGGLTLEQVAGQLEGTTSGGAIKASLPAPVPGNVKLTTSGGGISVSIPDSAALSLDAVTSGGGVSSELPVTTSGKIERNQLHGAVNGGGPTVFLRTGGGGISLHKR